MLKRRCSSFEDEALVKRCMLGCYCRGVDVEVLLNHGLGSSAYQMSMSEEAPPTN